MLIRLDQVKGDVNLLLSLSLKYEDKVAIYKIMCMQHACNSTGKYKYKIYTYTDKTHVVMHTT